MPDAVAREVHEKTPVKSTYTAQPYPGTRLRTATQSINQCRVGGWSGGFWTAWDRGCPSRPASTEWRNSCLLILVHGASVAGHLASLPATRIRFVRGPARGAGPSCLAGL